MLILNLVKHYEVNVGVRINEPRHEKPNILVSDLVRHKPGCTLTEDGYMLELSGIVLSM